MWAWKIHFLNQLLAFCCSGFVAFLSCSLVALSSVFNHLTSLILTSKLSKWKLMSWLLSSIAFSSSNCVCFPVLGWSCTVLTQWPSFFSGGGNFVIIPHHSGVIHWIVLVVHMHAWGSSRNIFWWSNLQTFSLNSFDTGLMALFWLWRVVTVFCFICVTLATCTICFVALCSDFPCWISPVRCALLLVT